MVFTVLVTEAKRLNLVLLSVFFATDTFWIAEGTPEGLGLLLGFVQLRKQPGLASAAYIRLHTVNSHSAQWKIILGCQLHNCIQLYM